MAEGRIVYAGALADQGRMDEALATAAQAGRRAVKNPSDHHLRLWYALADLEERAGEPRRAPVTSSTASGGPTPTSPTSPSAVAALR